MSGTHHREIGGSAPQIFQYPLRNTVICSRLIMNNYEKFVAKINLSCDKIGEGAPILPGLPNHFQILIPACVTQFSWAEVGPAWPVMLALSWCFCSHVGYPAPLAETPQQYTPLSCDCHTLQTLTSSSPPGLICTSCPVLEIPCPAGYNLLLKCHIIHHGVALPSSCKSSRRITLSHLPPYSSTPMEGCWLLKQPTLCLHSVR